MKKEFFKFVFLGAGSSVFTMRLVGDILKEDTIKKGHIALVDLDEKLLRETEEAVKELVAFSGQEFEVTAHIDYKEALPGTDYLFNTIATGGYERWKSDIEVSTKHGVLQSVGDTIGPGGIIRALRTIPVILDVAKTMEEICPDAWIINYANPEGAICLALQKYTKIKNFGLCHGTPDMAKQLAEEVFKVPIERFTYRAAGINHLTWFTDMKIDGKDVYPKLHDKLKESGFDKKEPISKQLYDIYGLYPAPGDRHVGEFFPYYMKEEVLMEQDYEWKNNDFKVVDGWREEARVLFDEVRTKKEGYEEMDYAKLDTTRKARTGFAEVVYCARKADEHLLNIYQKLYEEDGEVFGTRASEHQYELVKKVLPDVVYDPVSGILKIEKAKEHIGKVAVCTAGTADISVAEEAAQTAEYFGTHVERIYDVGVSGMHRLFSRLDTIQEANCVVAVAGMEGALASVMGGLVKRPVIAVPTSVGYGASFHGLSALLTMINSCANGIAVVNIDNGFGAGYLATQINRLAEGK